MLFSRRKRAASPDPDSIALLRRISGKHVTSVTAFGPDGVEQVLGRDGAVNVAYDDVTIICNGSEVFRCRLETVTAGELISLNGARISGLDREGNRLSVLVHYSRYA